MNNLHENGNHSVINHMFKRGNRSTIDRIQMPQIHLYVFIV